MHPLAETTQSRASESGLLTIAQLTSGSCSTILFASDRDRPGSGTAELYSIRDDGTQKTALSQDLRLSSSPSLSSSTSFRTDEPVELEWTYDALSRLTDAPLISSFTQKDQDLTTWRLLWELYDQRGDTKALVDQGGRIVRQQSYTPWGEQQGKPSFPYGFLGSYRRVHIPQTGLDLLGARQYNPKIGRFLSKDPIPGGSSNPYEYSGGDPINRVDPSGMYWEGLVLYFWVAHALICAFKGCPTPEEIPFPNISPPRRSSVPRAPSGRNASSGEPLPIDPSGYKKGPSLMLGGVTGIVKAVKAIFNFRACREAERRYVERYKELREWIRTHQSNPYLGPDPDAEDDFSKWYRLGSAEAVAVVEECGRAAQELPQF